MKIEIIPLLCDNYGWLLWDGETRSCAVVDPSEAGPVLARIREADLNLKWILATHHHEDHTGGIEALADSFPGVEVLCSEVDGERVPCANRRVQDGQQVTVAGSQATCLLVPGHTRGALAFYFPAESAVFTGDTFFLAGCGRLFEGTPKQMFTSLGRLAELPEDTRVYCGHEYTETNLRFARSVEADNDAVTARLKAVQALRKEGTPTVPATLGQERQTNPFLRAHQPGLQRLAVGGDALAVFTELRNRRNRF